jgi:hypothetical protein
VVETLHNVVYGLDIIDPLTEAITFEEWIAVNGLSEADVGEIIGRPRAYIAQRRALLRAALALIAEMCEQA